MNYLTSVDYYPKQSRITIRNDLGLLFASDVGTLGEIDNLRDIAKGKPSHRVGTTIENGDSSCRSIVQRSTGKADIGHIAHTFIYFLRREQVLPGTVFDLPWLLQVKQRRAKAVNKAVARGQHTVVNQQPAFGSLDGNRPRSYLRTLPGTLLEGSGRHDVAMSSPELHIGALAEEDVPEGGVARVGRAAEHQVHPVHLAGEEHRVAVEGDEGIFQPDKGLEIGGLGQADGRAVKVLAPDDVISVLDFHKAGVVGVDRDGGLALFIHKGDLFRVKGPADAVGAAAEVDIGDAVGLLAAEHADEGALIRHDRAVEDAGHAGQRVAPDDGVLAVAPEGRRAAGGLVLPGDVRQVGAEKGGLAHKTS